MHIPTIFHKKSEKQTLFRNFVFGVEDSLVSTVGLLAGVAAADIPNRDLVTTGLVLIFVEAFSMGIGSFLTEEATSEMAGDACDQWSAVKGALVMFVSYTLAGLLPLSPYLFAPSALRVPASVTASILGLVLLGYGSARWFGHAYPWRRALKMVVLGGMAVGVGMLVGSIFQV